MSENHFTRIAYFKINPLEHHIPGTRRRRKFNGKTHIVSLVHLYTIKLLKSLYSGLYLIGFGRLISECPYEIFCLLNHLLLILVCSILLLKPFSPQFKILAVRHLVIVNMTKHYFHCSIGHIVQKAPVVTDKKKRTPRRFQIVLKPLN